MFISYHIPFGLIINTCCVGSATVRFVIETSHGSSEALHRRDNIASKDVAVQIIQDPNVFDLSQCSGTRTRDGGVRHSIGLTLLVIHETNSRDMP